MIRDVVRFILCALIALAASGLLSAPGIPLAQLGGANDAQSTPTQAGTALVTAEQAVGVAVNDLEATADGYRLRHPRHMATFTPGGLQFTPRRGGPAWAWQLTAVTAGGVPLVGVTVGAVRPVSSQPVTVAYPRGGLVEQYLAGQSSLEQQFTILQSLPLDGADLAIAGAVHSAGTFEATDDGWQWRTTEGAVRLGDVRAYDASGHELPARMTATAIATRIVVDGKALAHAVYPVTIDPEIGANDFRLSDMGPDGDVNYDAYSPALAYNSTEDEFLVVWYGDDDTVPLVDGELEIFGQRVDGATGAEIGADLRLSDMGPDGNANYDALHPAVAYNGTDDEYLVVWYGDDNTGPLVDGEYEIYGQRVDGATGAEVGADLRLSDMGPDGSADYGAYRPAVAYNSAEDEYLVVWIGDDDTGPLVDGEEEIFGQRVDGATGAEIGADFRLSDMGPDGDVSYEVREPAVAHNSTGDEYLVVWASDDDTGGLVNGEFEIFGQRVDGATGAEIGANDFRLSDMGPDGNVNYRASAPAVAYNGAQDEYLVVWAGDDNTPPLVSNKFEIFGQRVDGATGAEIGANDFRLSDMGPDEGADFGAYSPGVAYNGREDEYLVVWNADDNAGLLVDDEYEVFGQQVDGATGAEIGANDFRLSDMGPDGDANYDAAYSPEVAYNNTEDEYLVVWQGDDDTLPLADEEDEIFGQRFAGGYRLYLPLMLRG